MDTQTSSNANFSHILSSIPKGDDALSDSVKSTKVLIAAHGWPGKFVIKSAEKGGAIGVNPEKVAELLSNHLDVGDYHGKLTIALKSCHAAVDLENEGSVMKQIADHLESNGYQGIRLTGADKSLYTSLGSSAYVPIGSDGAMDENGRLEKFSVSDGSKRSKII